jgi:hypothetical protein
MLAWIAAAALANPHSEPVLAVAVTHAWGAPIWGVRASVGMMMALDRCAREGGCAGDLHVVGGPIARIDWRGRLRFGLEADGMLGGGLVELHGRGFLPLTLLLVGAGPRLDETGIGLSTWAQAQQALGIDVSNGPNSHRTLGIKPIAVTVEGTVVFGLDAWYPSVAAGLQGSFWAADFFLLSDTSTAPPPPEP